MPVVSDPRNAHPYCKHRASNNDHQMVEVSVSILEDLEFANVPQSEEQVTSKTKASVSRWKALSTVSHC
jgi:hypothetical protein